MQKLVWKVFYLDKFDSKFARNKPNHQTIKVKSQVTVW